MSKYVLAALTSAAALAGCQQLMPASLTNLTAASADNPLQGAPLTWSRAARGTPFEGEKACTTWPLEDHLKVTATDTQICVKGQITQLVGASFGAPSGHSISVQSDGSGEGGFLAGQAGGIDAGRAQKVGSCTDHGSLESVWVESYDGCVPNKDHTGKQALTMRSTFLQVGDARWKFTPAPPAASAAAAPAPASGAPK